MPDTKGQSLAAALWNGLFAKPQTFPIQKEATQNPALDNQLSQGAAVPWTQPVPMQPVDNFNPLNMSPMNARHWTAYFADWYTHTPPPIPVVNPASVLMAVSKEADAGAMGYQDSWRQHYNLTVQQRKQYDPNNNYNSMVDRVKYS